MTGSWPTSAVCSGPPSRRRAAAPSWPCGGVRPAARRATGPPGGPGAPPQAAGLRAGPGRGSRLCRLGWAKRAKSRPGRTRGRSRTADSSVSGVESAHDAGRHLGAVPVDRGDGPDRRPAQALPLRRGARASPSGGSGARGPLAVPGSQGGAWRRTARAARPVGRRPAGGGPAGGGAALRHRRARATAARGRWVPAPGGGRRTRRARVVPGGVVGRAGRTRGGCGAACRRQGDGTAALLARRGGRAGTRCSGRGPCFLRASPARAAGPTRRRATAGRAGRARAGPPLPEPGRAGRIAYRWTCAANASYAHSSKRTNVTSSTRVCAERTVSTAMRAPSSVGHP